MYRLFTEFVGPPGAAALLLLRLVTGLAFMLHGWSKIQHPFTWLGADSWAPGFLQAIAAFAEFGGGLSLILGLLTPIACCGLVCVMTTAIVAVHLPKGDAFVGGQGGGSFELPLVYLAVALTLMWVGPGIYSLDNMLFKKKVAITPAPSETRTKAAV